MKTKYIITLGVVLAFLFSSCEKEDKRTVFPHSTPVIESAAINPSVFTYGDSVTVTAKVSDPQTPLSTLSIRMIVNDMLVTEVLLRTPDKDAEISQKVKVDYTSQLPDDANVEVQLILTNAEGDQTVGTIEGIKGKRKYYDVLYLVLDNGEVFELSPESAKSDKYLAEKIKIKSNKIRYRIAETITADKQIDFSSDVWGLKSGSIQLVDETGDYITTSNTNLLSISNIAFNSFDFNTAIDGVILDPNNIILDLEDFVDVSVANEKFRKISLPLKKDGGLTLEGDLASFDVVFNMDFFERTENEELAIFKGEDGDYDLYYSETRKVVIVDPANRAYPSVLLAAGAGLGYPSKAKGESTTVWDFNAPLQCIVFTKIGDDVFQASVYFDATQANFKFFENRDWGNEKKSSDFTLPSILIKDTDLGETSGNWYAAPGAVSGNYKMVLDLKAKILTAEPITLP